MATGGSDVTLPSTSDKPKSLACCLCRHVFRDLKLLWCSHSLCQTCLKDVIQRHPDGGFPCPSCGRDTQVLGEGASAFQTHTDDNEPEPSKDETLCDVHPEKKFDLFCVKCDILICMDCKLSEHLHHESQTLAEATERATAQLAKDKARLQEAKADVEKNAAHWTTDQQEFKEKKAVVEREIRQRHSTLVAAADKYRDEALEALEAAFNEKQNSRAKDLTDIHNNTDELRKLQELIDEAETRREGCKIVTVAKKMKSGSGSPAAVKQLMSIPHLTEVIRPVHRSVVPKDKSTMFDSMKNFIGVSELVQIKFAEAEVKAEEQFRSDDHDDITVFFVYCKAGRNVIVSFDPLYSQQKPPVKRYSEPGVFIREEILSKGKALVGKVSMQEKNETTVFSEQDHENIAKKSPSSLIFSISSSGTNSQIRTNKVVSRNPFQTKETNLFSINCDYHRGFDVHSSQDLLAVVTETKPPATDRKVLLFKRPKINLCCWTVDVVDTYTSPLTAFRPADVCFFTLRGQEVLLIADESNDVIHVVDVQNDRLTFSRFLAPGCPLLLQPTALNTDHKGRLWVGCRGGRLVTFEPLSTAAAAYVTQH